MISESNVHSGLPSFYVTGTELSDWLVQVPSELASEVGSNVPGEFIAPIKARSGDVPLGLVINPETLETGPVAGLLHSDLNDGMLLCGGTPSERRHVLTILVQELQRTDKRVLIVSNDPSAIEYTGLSEAAVTLELGRDLVLNPVDCEDIPRHIYVPQLLSALEVIAGKDLRGATDLELALGRAVALGNSTVADVTFQNPAPAPTAYSEDSQYQQNSPSKGSLAGMEAVRSLHQGVAARSFYGSQTVATRDLVRSPLTVVVTTQGYLPMEKFAFDLLCIKLAGLEPDADLVIILENAENMRIRNRRYMKRDSWSEMMLRDLKTRGPLVVTLDHPVDMAPGAIGQLSSCVSLRLRELPDIKTAVELLGISVVSTGIHSKARYSSRETSFLRVMPDGVALMVRNRGETCIPIRLNPMPQMESPTRDELLKRLTQTVTQKRPDRKSTSLLDRVTSGQRELADEVLKLLRRYEPLTEEALNRFIAVHDSRESPDLEGVLAKLEHSGMILRGHETHGGVSYANYRITMKGTMALRQTDMKEGEQ
jgi:hypothetical protein